MTLKSALCSNMKIVSGVFSSLPPTSDPGMTKYASGKKTNSIKRQPQIPSYATTRVPGESIDRWEKQRVDKKAGPPSVRGRPSLGGLTTTRSVYRPRLVSVVSEEHVQHTRASSRSYPGILIRDERRRVEEEGVDESRTMHVSRRGESVFMIRDDGWRGTVHASSETTGGG